MKIDDIIQNKKDLLEVGTKNPCENMSLEEIEHCLELLKEQGFLQKNDDGGYFLTKKGIKQARKNNLKENFSTR